MEKARRDRYSSALMPAESSTGSNASVVDIMQLDGGVRNTQYPCQSNTRVISPTALVYGGWSTAFAAAQSTDSLSTATNFTPPSLSDASSFDEDHSVPVTPPDASSLIFFQPTEIPVQHIHLYTGSFYYPPSSIPTSSPYKRRLSSSTSLAFLSSALSRKLRFGSGKDPSKAKAAPVILLSYPTRRETGPAITISPPDSAPAEVFRPGIQRLTSRHTNWSPSRHPLAGKIIPTPPPTPKPSSSSSPRSLTRFLLHVKSRANNTLSSTKSNFQAKSFVPKTVNREGGLIVPDPLGPEEIEENRLSIAWETRSQRRAREEKIVRMKAAKEAEAKRIFQENLHRYRVPFMGFGLSQWPPIGTI